MKPVIALLALTLVLVAGCLGPTGQATTENGPACPAAFVNACRAEAETQGCSAYEIIPGPPCTCKCVGQ